MKQYKYSDNVEYTLSSHKNRQGVCYPVPHTLSERIFASDKERKSEMKTANSLRRHGITFPAFVQLAKSLLQNLASILLAFMLSTTVGAEQAAIENLGKTNPVLVGFHQRYANEQLIVVGDRVHVAFAYEYANFSFIEGDDGIILIDSGFYGDAAKRALTAFRKISDKPIKAIIYTHIHTDHTGGAGVFAPNPEAPDYPSIYAPSGWEEFFEYSSSVLMPMVLRRAFAQNGVMLPRNEFGATGAGIGPVPTMQGGSHVRLPTVDITERTVVEIAGVTLELIPSPGDIASSHLMVWLPKEKILFAGDILGGTFPYMETARFEIDRRPEGFVESLQIAKSLQPEHIVAGHGRVLQGKEDVKDVLDVNINVIQYLIDQVERLIAKGYSADRIIDELSLPAKLANHPDLQPHYHKVEWMIRGMYLKRAGFVGDVLDLATHTESEEALRLVPLLGGPDKVLQASAASLASGDARWAARLATYVLLVEPENPRALDARLAAFRTIGSKTMSSNERNYLLTALLTESGKLDWGPLTSAILEETAVNLSSEALLQMFRVKLIPERAGDRQFVAEIIIDSEETQHFLSLDNSVLRYRSTATASDGTVKLSRSTLEKVFSGRLTLKDAVNQGLVAISGSGSLRHLPEMIE
jgi:uncharacterized sulfatase